MTGATTAPRLVVAAGHGLAGAPHDRDLTRLTRLAAEVCGARSAAIGLVADGLLDIAPAGNGPAGNGPAGNGPAGNGPAGNGMAGNGPAGRASTVPGASRIGPAERVAVRDTRADQRFAADPHVTGELGRVRFFAATPLRAPDGELLGSLRVFDDEVRSLDDRAAAALDELAEQVVQVLDLRRREGQLLDAVGQLLSTNDELGVFAGRIAHDLRAPLTAVLGFLALADGPFRGETSERARDCIGSALAAARRMRTLIDDLLAYATFTAAPRTGPVALGQLVDDVTADLDDGIRRAGALVGYTGPDEVVTDGTLLRQLLQNLVANAVTYAGPAPRVQVTVVPDGPTWRLEVADNGPGIPVDQRRRIFDPLFRLPGAPPGGGSGIGLATCARIAEALGGTIMVDDAPGGGALFRVTLRSG